MVLPRAQSAAPPSPERHQSVNGQRTYRAFEDGEMYAKDGWETPVTGWTGLWLVPEVILIVPAIVWFVKVQGASTGT